MASATDSFNVKDFGATGGGVNDDTAAILQAISAASKVTNSVLVFPSGVGYNISQPITIPAGIDVEMVAPLIYTGTDNITALTVGSASPSNLSRKMRLQVKRKFTSDWSNENSIGIKLINFDQCNVEIVQAIGFCIGVQCMGSNGGFAYNKLVLQDLSNNKVALDLTNEKNGWCNENLYLNGRFWVNSGVNTALSRYGVRITSKDGTYTENNNNVFLKPCFELQYKRGQQACLCALIEHGTNNRFLSIRAENSASASEGWDGVVAKVLNESSENLFEIGFGGGEAYPFSVDDQSKFPVSKLVLPRSYLRDEANLPIFSSGPLHRLGAYARGDNAPYMPTVHVARYNSTDVNRYVSGTYVELTPDYIELRDGTSVGVFVDTSNTNVAGLKRFVIRKDCADGFGGRVNVVCYDGNGVILTDDGNNPYVKGYSNSRPYWVGSEYGGCYKNGQDSEGDFYFAIRPEVKKIRVLLSDGSNNLRLRSFSIYQVDPDVNATVMTGVEDSVPLGVNIAEQPPYKGSFKAGKLFFNSLPSVGSASGWICTTGGIATNNSWVAGKAYSVGNQVKANGNVYQAIVAGKSGSTAPSGTGSSISDGTVKWKYVDKVAVFASIGTIGK
ncbi:hypothetical protein EDM56_17010 [Brevibacillus fluminis]|uniref:Rhamnogalacturonase A/B/Epimerase-like pectate lyase domain-containing protein n=1 Tax=Brevibacillus fluminis TaxID=511487 RepID=A0A3M8DGY9_9BACL|nr:glycosyl hydrolase family 28-related protein [Brevibacillus fluminis]RNB87362.1 hypothetical protein EDM56_17010 [Brevibacillus fluminis]